MNSFVMTNKWHKHVYMIWRHGPILPSCQTVEKWFLLHLARFPVIVNTSLSRFTTRHWLQHGPSETSRNPLYSSTKPSWRQPALCRRVEKTSFQWPRPSQSFKLKEKLQPASPTNKHDTSRGHNLFWITEDLTLSFIKTKRNPKSGRYKQHGNSKWAARCGGRVIMVALITTFLPWLHLHLKLGWKK